MKYHVTTIMREADIQSTISLNKTTIRFIHQTISANKEMMKSLKDDLLLVESVSKKDPLIPQIKHMIGTYSKTNKRLKERMQIIVNYQTSLKRSVRNRCFVH